ncbi:hypothetical protein [Cyclobacterium sp.]|uniref:hypothetical protein n=1 Tax=Cyclobacterium sp. TaxID=1966343 RepID=UPI0019B35023|nr:hypothetical protein [Cyclobacterium sp.]MBD3627624.1 hypothetical protein [Cyclobacterium sp.]
MYKADLVTGNLKDNTMTFEIEGPMELIPGVYVILTEEEYKESLEKGRESCCQNCRPDYWEED